MIRKLVKKFLGKTSNIKSDIPVKITNEETEFVSRHAWIQRYPITKIVDIGANEGQAAGRFRWLYPDAKIISFEPLPKTYQILIENFRGDTNFIGYNFALGSKTGKENIHLNEYSPSSSILKLGTEHKNQFTHAIKETIVEIEIKELDLLPNLIHDNDVTLIKIDVQGFEKYVIQGGIESIKKAQILIVELSFKTLYENEPLFDDVYQQLKALGFNYMGSFDQLLSPKDREILQQDAIFINSRL